MDLRWFSMAFPRYLHVFNRGLDRRIIFPDDSYRERFLQAAILSRLSRAPKTTVFLKQQQLGLVPPEWEMEKKWGPPVVDILAYCAMPNHYHFLLKELESGGVPKFMQRLSNGYTKYFNIREEREGRLFTSTYKGVRIEDDEQLIHVSRYIHINPHTSSFTRVPVDQLKSYPWSSLAGYLNGERTLLCQPEEVLGFFGSPSAYWRFVSEGLDDSLDRFPKDLFLDDPSY